MQLESRLLEVLYFKLQKNSVHTYPSGQFRTNLKLNAAQAPY